MLNHTSIDSFIFDLDGTLFKTEELVIFAFNKTFLHLESEGYLFIRPNKEQLLNVLGMTLDEIWNILLPDQPEEVHRKANDYMLKNELLGLKKGYGSLFPNVYETLVILKKFGFKLFIASNGLQEYVEGVAKTFNIYGFFDDIYTAGKYNTKTKKELVRMLKAKYQIDHGVMVGDRSSDIEAGISNQLFTIGCNFGYSDPMELVNSHLMINDFKQINEDVLKL